MAKTVKAKQPDTNPKTDDGTGVNPKPSTLTTGANPIKQPFINPQTARDAYDESKKWLRLYLDPCDEFERIARNRPSPLIDPTLPKVTDGTMSAIIQETPKRVIEQVGTGLVTCQMYPEYAAVADLILRDKLIPQYNRMGSMLQKQWNMMGKSMTYGMATSYTFYTSTNGIMHTDFIIPYIKDMLMEKGKVFAPDSNIRFMRSWYQKRDLQAIINRETQLEKAVKGYKSDWDLKMLAEFMNSGAKVKPAYYQTPAEKEKGDGYSGGYEVIHAFQKGVGAEFYSFAPGFKEGSNLRTKLNNDPRGAMPLDDQYCNIDLSNPIGRGQIELSGGIQNLMDQQLQLYQFMSTMMQGPPLMTWGNVNKNSLKFRPNAIWDMGNSAGNKVEAFSINNEQINTFVNNMQFLQSKIQNLNSTQDSSIGKTNGNVGQSKTDAGVQQQQERLGVSDNYLQQMSEDWFARQSATSTNLYFANMRGTDKIPVGPDEIRQLEDSAASKFVIKKKDGTATLNVDYNEIEKVTFEFKVEGGTSKAADDEAQLARIQQIIQDFSANPLVMEYFLGQAGKKINLGQLYIQQLELTNLKKIDTILTDMDLAEAEAAAKAPFPIIDKPQIRLNSADLSPAALVAALQAGGVNVQDPQAAAAPSSQAQLDYKVEMAKAQALQQSNQTTAQIQAHKVASDSEVNQAKLQQSTVEGATQNALSIANAAHQQGMDIHNTAMDAVQPQQPVQQSPQDGSEPSSPSVDNGQPQDPNQPQLTPTNDVADIEQHIGPMQPAEEQFAVHLIQRGFSDQDVEQAIVMIRQGMSPQQVIQTLGAKHATASR